MLGALIKGLTKEELKELLLKVREIEQRNPNRDFFVDIKGTENMSFADAQEVMQSVFPEIGTKPLLVAVKKGEHPNCEQVRQLMQMPIDLNNHDPEYMRVHHEAMEHLLHCKECFAWSYQMCEQMRKARGDQL